MCLSFPVREMMLCIRLNAEANETTLVPDIAVEAGSATIVVLANSSIDPKAFVGKKT